MSNVPEQQWIEAVCQAPEFRCGRLDMASYTGDGEMFRNVYVGDDLEDDSMVKQIRGPFCDEVAFAASDYCRLLKENQAQAATIESLQADNNYLIAAMEDVMIAPEARKHFFSCMPSFRGSEA